MDKALFVRVASAGAAITIAQLLLNTPDRTGYDPRNECFKEIVDTLVEYATVPPCDLSSEARDIQQQMHSLKAGFMADNVDGVSLATSLLEKAGSDQSLTPLEANKLLDFLVLYKQYLNLIKQTLK